MKHANFVCSNCGVHYTLEFLICPNCQKELTFKKPEKEKQKFKNQIELFQYVWQTREHKSEISNKELDNVPEFMWVNCFMHILAKGKYPELKFEPDNIMLGTPVEHFLCDMGTAEQRKKYEIENNCSFDVFYDKQKELLKSIKSK